LAGFGFLAFIKEKNLLNSLGTDANTVGLKAAMSFRTFFILLLKIPILTPQKAPKLYKDRS
jgi:hypothetical protein